MIQHNETDYNEYGGYVEKTKWFIFWNCPCSDPCVKIENDIQQRTFWGFLELDLRLPILVFFLSILPLLFFFLVIFEHLKIECKIIATITVITSYVFFMWSYFSAACQDPGYLPFDWIQTKKLLYTWEEQLSGLAITEEQVFYAYNNHPKFASFSKTYGRFVIRGDHICSWINNWVGKRNHKQFMLLCLWGMINSFFIILWGLVVLTILKNVNIFMFVTDILMIIIEICLFGALLHTFLKALSNLLKNMTMIQVWKNEKRKNMNAIDSMKEVFGNGNYFTWIIPTPAFGDEFDEETSV